MLFAPAYRLVQDLLAAKPGLIPMPQGAEESEVLFTLIAERYERRSLGITSNLVFSQWEHIFANPMATAAAPTLVGLRPNPAGRGKAADALHGAGRGRADAKE